MGMEVLSFEVAVTAQEQMRYQDEPSFFHHLRSNAARAMAEKTIEESARYERIDPDRKELEQNPHAPVRHRWQIGIQRDLAEVEARERQMDEARRKGLHEAAAFLLTQVSLYDRAEGFCKHVLVNQLHDMARALTVRANQ